MAEKINALAKDLDRDTTAKKMSEKEQGENLVFAIYDDGNVNSKQN